MTSDQQALWDRIRYYQIGETSVKFPFSDRLARDNGWSLQYALRVIHEYKRFIFLICTTGEQMTPSDQVDQAWHLHLLYTQDYWEDFCGKTLSRKIHHGPTKGGAEQRSTFTNNYERTLDSYAFYFGHLPPEDIWPDQSLRFSKIDFVRISRDDYHLIPKKFQSILRWIISRN